MKIKNDKKTGEKIKLEVWIDTCDDKIVDKIGKDMKQIACHPHNPEIKYKTFKVCGIQCFDISFIHQDFKDPSAKAQSTHKF